jgi:cytochrome c-type biogenesis protein CcmE
LLKNVGSSLLKLVLPAIRLEYRHQVPDIFVRSAKTVMDGFLSHKPVRILASKIILQNCLTDHHVAKEEGAMPVKWNPTANPD